MKALLERKGNSFVTGGLSEGGGREFIKALISITGAFTHNV